MEKEKKYTIGLLVGGITDSFTIFVCRGVIKAAKKLGIKLVIFPVKYLDRDSLKPKELMYEYQYNTLFSFVRKENLDAILVAADSIGFCTSSEKIHKILRQYIDIPCVLLASKYEGYISVNYDNKAGVREALEYLIHQLNCRKIGMIGGRDDNTDAYERKQIYLEVLKENGIPFEERNYVEGKLTRTSYEAFDKFIEQNPDVEAVFCVNDDTAIGFYEALRKHNLEPGKQVMVFGYDNISLASQLKPALSSVLADQGKLGEVALEVLIKMLDGEEVENVVLPTKFIRRDSVRSAQMDKQEENTQLMDWADLDVSFDNLFYCFENEDSIDDVDEIRGIFKKLVENLIFMCEEKGARREQKREVMQNLNAFLEHRALKNADMENFVSFIESVYQIIKRKDIGVPSEELRDIFAHVYRKIILAMNHHYGKMSEAQYENNSATKLFVRDTMQFQKGNDESYMVLLQHLEWFDIKNAYIYIFEKPVQNLYQGEFCMPEKLYLKATLKNGEVESIHVEEQETYIAHLFANQHVKEDGLANCLFPLYSNEMLYGVLLCDMTEKVYENGDFLVNQMSSAVKVIELLRTNDMIQNQLENSIVTLKENNTTLDSLSKIDALTGIYNRRGFNDAAKEFLAQHKEESYEILVAYVDMNNLKIINDKYGHNEGDFSIKKIGELLAEVVGEKGVVGRIGGDEFAFLMLIKNECNMVKEIYTRFQNFNETSTKKYNITVSAGTCVMKSGDAMTLDEALEYADARLYEEKQHKVKKVEK